MTLLIHLRLKAKWLQNCVSVIVFLDNIGLNLMHDVVSEMQEIPAVATQRKARLMKYEEFSQLRSVLPTTSRRSYTSPVRVALPVGVVNPVGFFAGRIACPVGNFLPPRIF